jgi:hypothetical protein
MPDKKERFIALNKINHDCISSNLILPHMMHHQVGIDVWRLELMSHLAGFQHLHLSNSNKHDSIDTQTLPQGSDHKPFRWKLANLQLNPNDIQSRIKVKGYEHDDPDAWAAVLGSKIKSHVIKSGTKELLHLTPHDKKVTAFYHAVIALAAIATNIENPPLYIPFMLQAYATTLFITNGAKVALELIGNGVEIHGRGSRFSLCVGPEIDRAIALVAIGSLSRLARVVPNPS